MKQLITIGLSILLLAAARPTQADEVRTLKLENGLDVVMMPDASSPLLSSLVIVRTGSSYETLSSAGSTHLLEHMIFRGTKTRTQDQIYDAFDRMGAYYNASTAKTYTNFILVVPKEDSRSAMDIQADMILNSTIDPDTFEVEKGRVIAEIQQSHNRSSYPAEVAHMFHVYGETSYGFPTLGSVEGIRALSRDTVAKFHRDWYAVNNMTLVMRGDLTFAEMENLAKEVYGHEPARKLPKRPESWPVGLDDWRQGLIFTNYGDVKSGTVNFTMSAPRFDDPDHPAFSVLALMLDDSLNAQLSGDGMPLVTYAYSSITNDPNFSVLDVTAGLMPGADPRDVVDGILAAVRSLATSDYTTDDLQRLVQNDRRQELFFSEQVQYGSFMLVPKLAVAPWGFWKVEDKARSEVDVRQAQNVSSKWFADPFWVASAYLPRGKETVGEGITLGSLQVDTLANGLIVEARQVDGAPVAGIHLIAKHRAMYEGDNHRGWVDVLHRMLNEGYGKVDADGLARQMQDIGMEMQTVDDPRVPMDNYRTTPEYSYVRIQVVSGRWKDALDLLGKLLADGTMDKDAIQQAAGELKGIINRSKGNLTSVAGDTFDTNLFGDNVLAKSVYGDGSDLDNIDPAALAALRADVFGSSNLVLSILAPAPDSVIVAATKAGFGDLKPSVHAAPPSPAPVSTPGEVTVTGRGRQGFLDTGFLVKNVDPADEAALVVANNMISDLIYRDLGEKRGWAYGAGSSLVLRPGWGAWSSGMGLPENHLDEANEAIYGHLARIAKGDIDQHRLEVAQGDLRGKILRRYSSRINLAMALGSDLVLHDDPMYTWKLYDGIQKVTLDDVKRVAKKYLSKTKDAVTVIGKPEPSSDKPGRMPMGMGGMGGMGGH